MSVDIGRKLMIWFYASIAALVILSVWIWNTVRPDDRLGLANTTVLSTDMQQEGNVRSYTIVLPEAFSDSQSLLFKSTHTEVEVLLEDTVIYTFGMARGKFGKSPGTYWHVVDIPAESEGKTLTVRQTTVYDEAFYGSQPSLKYGSHGDCVLEIIKSFWGILLLNCIILFAGFISLFLHIATRQKKHKNELGSFLCIGFFAITIAVWSLRQCGFLQFIIPNALILYFIDMIVFFLFPAAFNLFVYTICRSEYRKGFIYVAAAYLVEMAIVTTLQLLGVMDIFELLRAIHVLMGLNAVYVFWAIYQESRLEKNSIASKFRLPLYILMGFGLMELLSYYIRIFEDVSIFLPTGTIVFIMMLIWQQIKEYYRALLEEQKMIYYEKLANTDMLTGAQNRNAYETQLKILEAADADLQGQCIILFDLNNMKIINDNFGHEKGDEALKTCYDCMQKMFGDKGICYRIGGDEFAFLSRNAGDLSNAIAGFNEMIAYAAQQMEYPFCVALGYAVFDPDKDEDFRSTIRRSDSGMYEDKKMKKGNLKK